MPNSRARWLHRISTISCLERMSPNHQAQRLTVIVSVPLPHKGTERFLLVCAAVFAVNTCTYCFHLIYNEAKHTQNHIYIFMSPAAHINFLAFTLRSQVKAIYYTEHVQRKSKDSRTNTYKHWSFLHVFTELSEFNDKKYLSSTGLEPVTSCARDQDATTVPARHASMIYQFYWIHWKFCSI